MSKMLHNELNVMRKRKVPETDPRIVAIKRILAQQLGTAQPGPVYRGTNNVPFNDISPKPRRIK